MLPNYGLAWMFYITSVNIWLRKLCVVTCTAHLRGTFTQSQFDIAKKIIIGI